MFAGRVSELLAVGEGEDGLGVEPLWRYGLACGERDWSEFGSTSASGEFGGSRGEFCLGGAGVAPGERGGQRMKHYGAG